MKIQTTGRKVALKPSFIERVEKRLGKMDRFFTDEAEAFVTVTVEKNWQTVELTIRDKGMVVRSEKSAEGMEQAFDAAVEVVMKQIVKNRRRLEDKLRHGASEILAIEYPEEPEEETVFQVTREKTFFLRPTTVEEAILQMNLLGHTFYMFRNADTDDVNVVYKRKDGNYGLIMQET